MHMEAKEMSCFVALMEDNNLREKKNKFNENFTRYYNKNLPLIVFGSPPYELFIIETV